MNEPVGHNLGATLLELESISRKLPPDPALRAWGERHLELAKPGLDDWCARAWWGMAAGELMARSLENPSRRDDALSLVDVSSFDEVEMARHAGGVILAAAHLGPRKTAMHGVLEESWPLMVWTHYAPQAMPAWMKDLPHVRFLDPMDLSTANFILGRSALHLRNGGILFGAPDVGSGARRITRRKFGADWQFSLGLPALARRLETPVFFTTALWKDRRVLLTATGLEAPPRGLSEDEWFQAWVDDYSARTDSVIASSPENLRFLRWIFSPDDFKRLLEPMESIGTA